MSTLIELSQLTKQYSLGRQTIAVLKDIHLTLNQGEMVAIMGTSGSGKSTLLNILGLLDRPTEGSYQLVNEEVANLTPDERAYYRNAYFGFVFQSFFLLPRLNARQNISLPLQYGKYNQQDHLKLSEALLAKVGMANYGDHKPMELSGGQQQRVAIARALINNPKVILADEPTGALDSHTGKEIIELFLHLNQTEGATIILVTHDHQVAQHCQRIIQIKDGCLVSE